MQIQDRLFHEDWRDSLRHVVKALGGYETVGADLWPNKTRKAAGNWLYDCLSDERPAKLDLEDIEALLKRARDEGIHTGMYFLAKAAGYEHPEPAAPKSPQAILLDKYETKLRELRVVQDELDRMNNGAALKVAR